MVSPRRELLAGEITGVESLDLVAAIVPWTCLLNYYDLERVRQLLSHHLCVESRASVKQWCGSKLTYIPTKIGLVISARNSDPCVCPKAMFNA